MPEPALHTQVAPPPWERTPPTLRPAARASVPAWLVRNLARPLWGWRLELATGLLGLVVWGWLARGLGRLGGLLVLAALGGSVAFWPAAWRGRVAGAFHRASLRRGWAAAVRHAGLATHNDRTPRVTAIVPVPAGELLRVRIPAGSRTAMLADQAETIAACLAVRDVQVTRDPDNARTAQVVIVRRDPLTGWAGLPWPEVDAPRLDLWAPVVVGVDELGRWVTVRLPERNLLLGGEPGSGKSAAAMVVATAALDPAAKLTLFDGKRVELACWSGVASTPLARRWTTPSTCCACWSARWRPATTASSPPAGAR
jgi:hypothetical protein